jgi:hypothetical protein
LAKWLCACRLPYAFAAKYSPSATRISLDFRFRIAEGFHIYPAMQSPILSLFRSASLLALSLTAVSCTSGPPYRPDGNVFVERGANQKPAGTTSYAAPTDTPRDPNTNPPADPANATAATTTPPTPAVENPSTPAATPENPVTDPVAPPTTTEVKPKPNLPFGTPVIGKRGFVYSPYAPDKGMVDVSDIPSGTKVECPYTKKIFRVP